MKTLKQEVLEQVRPDVESVEEALRDNLDPFLDLVTEVAHYILFAGGKRLRPLLMLLSAKMCGFSGQEAIRLSTVFEYLHTATLLHDDIVDEAFVRRGKPTANTVWGNQTVVLVGDFLLARTCSIATDTGKISIIKAITEITGVMSQGEIQQLQNIGNLHLTENDYDQIIYRKTAALMEAACKVGGLVAEAPEKSVRALAGYGRHLGMAFQMADDLLDYTADPSVSGKALGVDLQEGKMTLPLIYAMAHSSLKDQSEIKRIIGAEQTNERDFLFVLEKIRETGGTLHTMKRGKAHVNKAKEHLSVFPKSETRDLMAKIADFVMERES